jgi:hypothetical protein
VLHLSDIESKPPRVASGRPSLWRLLKAGDLPLDYEFVARLLDWIALRNGALHEEASVTAAQAKRAVAEVELARRALA